MRVHSLARTLGTTSKRVLDALSELDGRIRSAHSTVDRAEAVRVRDLLAAQPQEPPENAGDTAAEVVAAENAGEPESRLMLETRQCRRAPHYMPLFVAPQPLDSDDDSGNDDEGADSDDSDSDSDDDEDQADRSPNRRRRRGRRGRGRGRGEQGGPEGNDGDDDEAPGRGKKGAQSDSGDSDDADDEDSDDGDDPMAVTTVRPMAATAAAAGAGGANPDRATTTTRRHRPTIRRTRWCTSGRPVAARAAAQMTPPARTTRSKASTARRAWRPSGNGAGMAATPDAAARRC
ncbi:translation initiation factor IF-2 N-terminal domain-containing protein [Mycobacterium marseillense]|uniref:translation initiation factor IF-2 N-terminal domain-containing protein n=1 Tax=Mycobacterium marseillense TaxID=701042 RepID=UPI0013CFAE6A